MAAFHNRLAAESHVIVVTANRLPLFRPLS
jgi:hypothetical protein